jgi:hypothetical protein
MGKWISVNDKLPEHMSVVVCINAINIPFLSRFICMNSAFESLYKSIKKFTKEEQNEILEHKEKIKNGENNYRFSNPLSEEGECFSMITHWFQIPKPPQRDYK